MGIDLNKNESEQNPFRDDMDNEVGRTEQQAMFSHAFSFSGRIGRLEFILSYTFIGVLNGILSIVVDDMPLLRLLAIPFLWFLWAQMSKRFHDIGYSGRRIFTLLIPIYNIVVLFMLFFKDGEPCENDYGKDPKGRNMYA